MQKKEYHGFILEIKFHVNKDVITASESDNDDVGEWNSEWFTSNNG